MLDWIFEGIVTWISSVVSDMMDAVSGLFLQALGTDMTAMEEYFPFVSKAFMIRKERPPITKPREKTREELQAEKSSLCSVFCAFAFI